MRILTIRSLQTAMMASFTVAAAWASAQEASFKVIPSQNTVSQSTTARGVSADGSVVSGVEDGMAWRWTALGGVEYLSSPDWQNTWFTNVSADGSTIISSVDDGNGVFSAALYTDADGWTNLGGLFPNPPSGSDSLSTGYSVNGDGTVAVGLAWVGGAWDAEAFIWNEADGMTGLGRPVEANSRANDISADGTVIVGWYEHEVNRCRRPVRWTPEGTVDLFLGPEICGEAHAVSSDGSVIVGQAFVPGNDYYTAFKFSDEDGWVDLGRLGNGETDGAIATGIADNGTIVGLDGNEAQMRWRGFIWTASGGMQYFSDYLTSFGVDLTGHSILESRDISADGTSVIGMTTNPSWGLQGYVATIPATLFDDDFESGDLSAWSYSNQ